MQMTRRGFLKLLGSAAGAVVAANLLPDVLAEADQPLPAFPDYLTAKIILAKVDALNETDAVRQFSVWDSDRKVCMLSAVMAPGEMFTWTADPVVILDGVHIEADEGVLAYAATVPVEGLLAGARQSANISIATA